MKPLTIIIADDHPIVLRGIHEILMEDGGFDIIAEPHDGKELIKVCEQFLPQLLLTDISLPGLNGLDVVERLKRTCPEVKMLLMSIHHEVAFVKRALQLEVSGFISKRENFDHLPNTLRAVLQGTPYYSPILTSLVSQIIKTQDSSVFDHLTSKERELLHCLASEKSTTAEIAKEMGIASGTVRKHLQNIMDKLDLHKRWELIQFAKEHRFSPD